MSKRKNKPSDTGLMYGVAIIGTVGLMLLTASLWGGEIERREVRSQADFDALMASMRRNEPKEVVLWKAPEPKKAATNKLPKSAKAIELAALTPACADPHDWGCVLSEAHVQFNKDGSIKP